MNVNNTNFSCHRVIDVGSEWRTFSNEANSNDPSRVGGPENSLLSGGDLSTMIGPATGSASFDEFGSKLAVIHQLESLKFTSNKHFFSRKISEQTNDEQL